MSRSDVIRRLRAAGCVFAEEKADLLVGSADDAAALVRMVQQRVSGLPLEHVLGWVRFCGLRLAVGPGVFVPRRRTELLVRRAAALAAAESSVVDLACGCGAVGRAIAQLAGPVAVHAVDVDPAAVGYARRNLLTVDGRVYVGDLYEPLPAGLRGAVDVLVANVPYVPTGSLDLLAREARHHEPVAALDGGPDGLDLLRRVAGGAPQWLAPGGHVLVEIGVGQERGAVAAMDAAGLAEATVVRDPQIGATIVTARSGAGR